MSRLAEFRKLEQSLAAQLAELEAMKGQLRAAKGNRIRNQAAEPPC